jgi:hypothetical protein
MENLKSEQKTTNILFLAADPSEYTHIRVEREYDQIADEWGSSINRDRFALFNRFSVKPEDISRFFITYRPHIVHFSSHCQSSGELCLVDEHNRSVPITPEDLSGLFGSFRDQVDCVILNSCYSEIQAQEINKHIEYTIGMSTEIEDPFAIAFSRSFYRGLFANFSIEGSFELAKNDLGKSSSYKSAPVIKKREDISKRKIFTLFTINYDQAIDPEQILTNLKKILADLGLSETDYQLELTE